MERGESHCSAQNFGGARRASSANGICSAAGKISCIFRPLIGHSLQVYKSEHVAEENNTTRKNPNITNKRDPLHRQSSTSTLTLTRNPLSNAKRRLCENECPSRCRQAQAFFKQNREARMRREQQINSKPIQQESFHFTHTHAHESKRTGLPAALSLL